MRLTEVRVPGKVMLSGEYAVLYGAPAVLAPVDRELVVREASQSPLPESPSPVLQEALREPIGEIEEYERGTPLKGVEVDRSAFRERDGGTGTFKKLGIGSSAAEAVGVIALRYQRAGIDWRSRREEVARSAERAHRRAQGGIGSGADVYACAYGVPIRFQREGDEISAAPIEPAQRDPHAPPLTLVWTGKPANTRELVRQFQSWHCTRCHAAAKLAAILEAAQLLADCWFRCDLETLRGPWERFVEAVERYAQGAGMAWWPEGVPRELASGLIKPTGAGGGDMMLVAGEVDEAELPGLRLRISGESPGT